MSFPSEQNPWARRPAAQSQPADPSTDRAVERRWRLAVVGVEDGDDLFKAARANVVVRFVSIFAKHKALSFVCGVGFLLAAIYCLSAPAGTTLGGLPAELCTIVFAGGAVALAFLIILGAWLRPLESMADSITMMGVPLVALTREAEHDVH